MRTLSLMRESFGKYGNPAAGNPGGRKMHNPRQAGYRTMKFNFAFILVLGFFQQVELSVLGSRSAG